MSIVFILKLSVKHCAATAISSCVIHTQDIIANYVLCMHYTLICSFERKFSHHYHSKNIHKLYNMESINKQ